VVKYFMILFMEGIYIQMEASSFRTPKTMKVS